MKSDREDDAEFHDAVQGLIRGDFSRLESLFDGDPCRIVKWFEKGYFVDEPGALAEALSCACFNGRTAVATFLMDRGVDPSAGDGTGMNAFHWAVNRGQLATVMLLIERNAPLDSVNIYGGTVLDTAIWSAEHEPRPGHPAIIEALRREISKS